MNNKISLLISLLICLVLSIILFPGCGCGEPFGEPFAPIVIKNETEQTLTIYVKGLRAGQAIPGNRSMMGRVAPYEEIKNESIPIYYEYIVEVDDNQARLVFSRKYTAEERDKMTITITPDMLTNN